MVNTTEKQQVKKISWWGRLLISRAIKAYYGQVTNTTDKLLVIRLALEIIRKVRNVLNKDPDDHYLLYLYHQLNITVKSQFNSLDEQLLDLEAGVLGFRNHTPVSRELKGLTGLPIREHEGIDFMLVSHSFNPYAILERIIKSLVTMEHIYLHRIESEHQGVVNNDFTLLTDRVRKLMECLEGYFIAMSVPSDTIEEALAMRASKKGV